MCMQNCNSSFQTLVLKKDFLKDVLVKHLNPKYNLPVQMQNRILRFIMTWSSGSHANVDQTEVKELYLELIKKGIHFPPLEPTEDEIRQSQRIGKLYSELDVVRMNIKVMSAILLENYPGSEVPEDMELLEELQKVCHEMQARILKLLETVQNDDVIIELVQVNDDLNNLFLRYNRFSRTRSNQSTNNIKPDNTATFNDNQPSAPSSELLELNLDPLPHVHNITNGYPLPTATANVPVPGINPQQVHNLDAGGGQNPLQQIHNNTIYPQRELMELREAVTTPFLFAPQNPPPKLPPIPLYDNSPLLPTVPALSPTVLPLAKQSTNKTSSKPDDSNNNLPNYYELLEFDPLADSKGTEVVYEEIDPRIWKTNKASEC
uniref:TOM1-like protein 1 n=1 Tax=Pyxicephalus adspersus TaxID=30357 RepID=A0AAV3AXK4_PYXAD|nr:TPA: hypothetical protein GDO54_008000 [Pyxicephalus adspersus]